MKFNTDDFDFETFKFFDPDVKAYDYGKYDKKETSEMTFNDALIVINDNCSCDGRSCGDCLSHQKFWEGGNSCNDVRDCAAKIIVEYLMKGNKKPNAKTDVEEQERTSPNMLSHAQTIGFMKRCGFTHCYMCGADLGKDD